MTGTTGFLSTPYQLSNSRQALRIPIFRVDNDPYVLISQNMRLSQLSYCKLEICPKSLKILINPQFKSMWMAKQKVTFCTLTNVLWHIFLEWRENWSSKGGDILPEVFKKLAIVVSNAKLSQYCNVNIDFFRCDVERFDLVSSTMCGLRSDEQEKNSKHR